MLGRLNMAKRPSDRLKRLLHIVSIVALLCCGRALVAQVDQGTITGTATDTQGAVVSGAKVTLTQLDTGFILQGTTNSAGIYVFSPVKIGRYSVAIAAAGFESVTQTSLNLDVNQTLTVDFTLHPGNVTQSVTVQASAAELLQKEDASTGQVVSSQVINDTPLALRNYVFIAQLAAGVTEANGSRGQGRGDFNANGLRAEQNNFILDGVDNNSNQVDFLNGASFVVKPPPDALQEFKVQTSDYDAEFGHSAGAVVNASIKSGTNDLHGDMWEYVRNNDLGEARDFFNRTCSGSACTPGQVPAYHQNQFGATLGGPIIKDKLFWFGDLEVLRVISPSNNTYTVPTALMRTGDFSELLNTNGAVNSQVTYLFQPGSANIATPLGSSCGNNSSTKQAFCPGQIDTLAQHILSLYPQPNTGAAGQTYNNYVVNTSTGDNTVSWDTRIDWNPTEKDQAFFRMSYYNERGTYNAPFGPILDGGGYGSDGNNINMGENYALSYTHTFTPTLINEFRFGYNWGHPQDVPLSANTNVSAQEGLGGIPYSPGNGGLPNTAISGLSGIGGPQWYPAIEFENVFQFLDNVTKVKGKHTIKMGADFQHVRVSTTAPIAPHGYYDFSGFYTAIPGNTGLPAGTTSGFGAADFLADTDTPPGAPTGSAPGSIDNAELTAFFNVDNTRWYRAAYVQDQWRVLPKLTVNVGLRYENFQPVEERHDHQSLWYPTSIAPGAGASNFVLADSQKNTYLAPGFLNLLTKDHINLLYTGTRSLVQPQYTQFAPRVGLDYTVTDKLVARAGFGLFFGGLESIGGAPNLGYNYPFQYTVNFKRPACQTNNCQSIGQTYGINLAQGFSTQPGWNNGLADDPAPATPGLVGAQAQYKTPYTQQWNFSLQYAFSNSLSWTMGYVGNNSRHIEGFPDQNAPDGLVGPNDNANNIRPFPDFGGSQFDMHEGVSSYNALQTTLQKQYTDGLSFVADYTWGHALDDTETPLNGGSNLYRSPLVLPMGIEYTNSDWDVRQRVALNAQYALPFGRGKKYLNQGGIVNEVIGGWSTDLVFTTETGLPFTITPNNSGANGANTRRAYLTGNAYAAGGTPNSTNPSITCATSTKNITHWFNPCAFSNPLSGGNIANTQTSSNPVGTPLDTPAAVLPYVGPARNQLYGPGYNRINMSLFKSFTTFHEQHLDFRADAFNLFNTPAFNTPSGGVNTNSGQITSTHNMGQFTPNSRFLQLALKYYF